MSYKSILVNLDIDGPIVPIVKAATDLARRSNARLIGFCAADAYLPVMGPEGAALAAEVWQEMKEDDERRFKALRKEFEALVAGAVDTEWRVVSERPTYALVQTSRAADLIVTQATAGAEKGDAARSIDTAGVALRAGRPLLVLSTETESVPGKKIVVAWKDTREARRAVSDAVPLLQAASQVTIVTVVSAVDPWIKEGVADVAAFLRRHGVESHHETIESDRESESLIESIDRHDADLVVSGAFGHSRLREWAFGGVTRSLLDETRLNRFMSN
jgi:nucleotide-binding universal stress UspA family protein